MKRLVITWFLVIANIVAVCGFKGLKLDDQNTSFIIERNDYSRITTPYMRSGCVYENDSYVFIDIYDFNKLNMDLGWGIFRLKSDLTVELLYHIHVGKGPNEGQGINSIFKINDKYYVFDQQLFRFLVFNTSFKYVDAVSFNSQILLSAFVEAEGEFYALESSSEGLTIYLVSIENEVILKKLRTEPFESKVFRSNREKDRAFYSSIRHVDQKNIVIVTNSTAIFIERKKGLRKVREVYLGDSKKTSFGYSKANIFNVDHEGNIQFRHNGSFIYDYKKNKVLKVKEGSIYHSVRFLTKEYMLQYDDKIEKYRVKLNSIK